MRIVVLMGAVALIAGTPRSPEIRFTATMIDGGISETCAIADFNGDGKPDIFSGESWYENPSWKKHTVRELKEFQVIPFLESLSDLALDVDEDGRPDIVSTGWFAKRVWWSRNPGRTAAGWQDHEIESPAPRAEFAFLVDLNNDGREDEVLPQFGAEGAETVWYERAGGKLQKHVVSPRAYGHGIGAGDVNKDGRNDIVTPLGWLEAPPDPRRSEWRFHEDFKLGSTSFIFVIDLNEDGLPDLLTGMAHDYGIFWMEQRPGGTWVKHVIDESWSQPHAMTLADINGDGRKDLLTGKRYMAHNGRDPGEREPLGLYWYEYRPQPNNEVIWVRHLIEYATRAGAGMQLPVADLDGDGDMDFAAGGKSGLFVFLNQTTQPHRTEPKVRQGGSQQ